MHCGFSVAAVVDSWLSVSVEYRLFLPLACAFWAMNPVFIARVVQCPVLLQFSPSIVRVFVSPPRDTHASCRRRLPPSVIPVSVSVPYHSSSSYRLRLRLHLCLYLRYVSISVSVSVAVLP